MFRRGGESNFAQVPMCFTITVIARTPYRWQPDRFNLDKHKWRRVLLPSDSYANHVYLSKSSYQRSRKLFYGSHPEGIWNNAGSSCEIGLVLLEIGVFLFSLQLISIYSNNIKQMPIHFMVVTISIHIPAFLTFLCNTKL